MPNRMIASALGGGWLRRGAEGVATLSLAVSVSAVAFAQSGQGSGNRHFKGAPVPKEDNGGLDTIMGIHINTIFFIAVGVIALLWFTVGGGRKAKIGRSQQ